MKQKGKRILSQRNVCDVICSSTPETCGLIVNMKRSKWISLQHNCIAPFIADSKGHVLAKVLFDDDGYLIETINLPREALQSLKVHLGFGIWEHRFTVIPFKFLLSCGSDYKSVYLF